ncbi:MAG: arsenic efflux protein [Firmicutes bacterium]|nr:arsenic efflux protein [Bacillota bacterium]
MLDILKDTCLDSIKLLPFLIVTYLVMEMLERAAGEKTERLVAKAGSAGPLIGAVLGAFPQCGFSAAAANFYSGGIIGIGTLIAVFMSTSDEMLPVFIAERADAGTIGAILGVKIVTAVVSGYLVAFLFRRFFSKRQQDFDQYRKEHGHDCSEDGHSLVAEVALRTGKTFAFIFLITLALNALMAGGGEAALVSLLAKRRVLGELLAGLVGLIPNCGASIAISKLYLEGVIGAGAMMSGLFVSAGTGLLVLFEENRNLKENLTVILILYVLGVAWGLLISAAGIRF